MEFRLLGSLEVWEDGRRLALGGAKQRALLAVLLLRANEVVSRDVLIDEVWGDSPPASAAHSIDAYVSRLRKTFDANGATNAVLVTHPSGYMLRVGFGELDVARFERLAAEGRRALAADAPERAAEKLREALSLWRGPALGDLAFEPFARIDVERLEELRLATLEERLEADLAAGRHDGLVAELEALVARHPLRERLRGQLMLALYRSGRQAEALEAYREARGYLVGELGLEPSPKLKSLEQAILRQDPGLGAPPGKATTVETEGAAAAPTSRLTRRALVGAAALLAVAIATVAAIVVLTRSAEGGLSGVDPNHVGVIDPQTNEIVAQVPVGIRPGPIAAKDSGPIWVGDLDDKDLSRIDPRTRQPGRRVALGATPTAVAAGVGAVWVAEGLLGKLVRVDPEFSRMSQDLQITSPKTQAQTGSVTVGGGSVWAVYGDSTLVRVDAGNHLRRGYAGDIPSGIAYYKQALWVVHLQHGSVYRYDPATFESGPVDRVTVGLAPRAIAAGAGFVWIADTGADVVSRIDPATNTERQIAVGDGPTAVAVGAGGIWVVNGRAGTISRIDPAKLEVVKTIEVGNLPAGVVVADGLVWVTVDARP